MTAAPDVRVAVLGDSFAAGVGDPAALGWVGRVAARARATGWDLTAYPLGIRRETTPEIGRRLLAEARPRLRDGDAHGLVVAGGVNDTTVEDGRRRATEDETLTALDGVLAAAAAASWPVLVVGPALVADPAQNERIEALSRALAARCTDRGVPYAEVAAPLAGDADWIAEIASVDGAHPGAAGYQRLADLVWPAFADWLAAVVGSAR
ncbi:GDSL-type esterase/lipase family protein [Modestobacter sp. NPDC049651]|uniref:GDSL-type esterase/lipase family protein n=1 Tax=unclassified Modestobacter TaxID=2643866 RepID=UPI0033CE4445